MAAFFNIDGKLCTRFLVGTPDNEDGYVSGYIEDERPMVFARVYNSAGDLLFEVSHNQLVYRTPKLYRLIRSATGWKVTGRNKKSLLTLTTEVEDKPKGASVTYVNGTVWDKEGRAICKAGDKSFAPAVAMERKKA